MVDPRNRPALLGAIISGIVACVLLWWLGLSPYLAWIVGWTLPAFALYGIDKRQAESGGWRVGEPVLHGVALIGGVPGAWAGRALFHHKTRKTSFTLVLIAATVLWGAIALWAVIR